MNLSDDPILTVHQVAEYLQLSKSKVYYMIQRRNIPFIRLGKNVRIRRSDLLQWIEKQTEKTE
jgi:excisionase family DNA binding protein